MNQELLKRVLQSPRLPSLPTIALEVIDLVQRQDVNIKQIACTIQHDPALSTKILKTVNSSFYGQAHSISTISHALVVLGLNSVKTLALGFSLVNNLKGSGGEGFNHFDFWKRSLYSATGARSLAKIANLVQQEEAFLGGLLQDLGMLALNQTLAEDYTELLVTAEGNHKLLLELENAKFEMDHAEVGAALAEAWNLPPLLIAPIRYHEQPEACSGDLRPLVQVVATGNLVADVFMGTEPGDALDNFHAYCLKWFNIPQAQAEELLRSIHKSTVEMRRLFDLPTGELGNADEILARANEAMLQLSLRAQQQSSALEQQNRQLVEQASTDSLTGVANRGKFNATIADAFAKSRATGSPLSLLFFDADHFKKFNDTYGHLTGDRVLVELAALLSKRLPPPALVARYGGEEFAVVLPGVDRVAAAKMAEQVRLAIAAMPVESEDGQPLKVTASIGVATLQPGIFEKPEQLIKAADLAVYAAKHAGRNAVRIFTPKAKAA
jgi:diguanylate cyclase (GGDEF)-like protein